MRVVRRWKRRWALAAAAGVALVVLIAPAAPATAAVTPPAGSSGSQVVIRGDVVVPADRTVDAVVVVDGDVLVEGRVHGTVVVANGDVRVAGDVRDNVLAFNGRVTVARTGHVGGDVSSSKTPVVVRGARIDGRVRTVDFAGAFTAAGWALRIAWWIAVTVSLLVLGLLFNLLLPRAATAAAEAARREVGGVVGAGALAGIAVPIAALIVLVTLVGIPLGLAVLASMALWYPLGWVVSAGLLGRLILPRASGPYGPFLLGWVILRIVGAVPILGGLVWIVASVYGIGALARVGWRVARRPAAGDEPGVPVVATPSATAVPTEPGPWTPPPPPGG